MKTVEKNMYCVNCRRYVDYRDHGCDRDHKPTRYRCPHGYPTTQRGTRPRNCVACEREAARERASQ